MENIRITKVEECHHEAILDFLFLDFFRYERLNASLAQEYDRSASPAYISWMREGYSLVAIDTRTNAVAGIAINSAVNKSDAPFDISSVPQRRRRILRTFIHELEKTHDIFEELSADKGLDLSLLGVGRNYSGQGLAKRLTEEIIKLAKERDIQFIQSIPTAAQTIHIFEKFGFQTKSEMKPIDFCYDGVAAFPKASPTDLARFVVKPL